MSFGEPHARAFLDPLKGKSATFIVKDRAANYALARVIFGLLAAAGQRCTVFDLDAFYASNSDRIFGPLPRGVAEGVIVRVPGVELGIEDEFAGLFGLGRPFVLIDSLNSLYHLLSEGDGAFRSRKLSFAVAGLSYVARTMDGTAILTMYQREGFSNRSSGRSISDLSDVTVAVEATGSELIFRVEKGDAWTGRTLSIRTP